MHKIMKNFFVIEGLDGSGTTTQLNLLNNKLENLWTTFEPTDNEIGKLIRKILRKEIETTPLSLAYLYAADRADHISTIQKRINQNNIVVSDRYFFSSLAYQSLKIDFSKIKEINDFPYPEKVFFIDTPVDECIRRIALRGEPTELFEKKETLLRVLKNYEKAFLMIPEDCTLIRIDGLQSPEVIINEILKNII